MKYLPARAASSLAMTTPAPTTTIPHQALAVRQATTSSTSSATGLSTFPPLTTIFTPPASCFDRNFGVMQAGTVSGNPSAFRDYSAADAQCYPDTYSEAELSTDLWFSPGVCPSGYARASQAQDTADNNPSLTLAWCCPSSMAYSWDGTYDYCSSYCATSTVVNSGTYTTPVPFSGFVALQWPISVMWREKDLSSFDPPSAPVLAATQSLSSTSTHTRNATRTQGTKGVGSATLSSTTLSASPTGTGGRHNGTNSSHAYGGGLSTGAQVGIGVGVAVPCVALLGLGIWFFLYRRRTKSKRASDGSDSPTDGTKLQPYGGMKAELPGEEAQSPRGYGFGKEKRGLQHGQEIAELEPERDGLNELEGQNKHMEPVELPGNAIGENAAVEAPTDTEARSAARKTSRDPLVGGG